MMLLAEFQVQTAPRATRIPEIPEYSELHTSHNAARRGHNAPRNAQHDYTTGANDARHSPQPTTTKRINLPITPGFSTSPKPQTAMPIGTGEITQRTHSQNERDRTFHWTTTHAVDGNTTPDSEGTPALLSKQD